MYAFAPDQERLTPSSLPTRYVTAPAPPPIASMRRPSRTALRPVKRLIIEPTPNKATAVIATAAMRAPSPRANRNGASGTSAPTPNEKKEDSAAPQGEPRFSGLRPSSSRASVSRASSEEHTSELQSPLQLVCRLLLETKTRIPSWPSDRKSTR